MSGFIYKLQIYGGITHLWSASNDNYVDGFERHL